MVLRMVGGLPAAAALAGLWLLLAACGGKAAGAEATGEEASPVERTAVDAERGTAAAAPPAKRDPAETIEWRDGRFATVWDPGP